MITIEFTATTLALAMTPARAAALAHVDPGEGGGAAGNVTRSSSAKESRTVGASMESARNTDAARRPQALSAGRTRQATGNSRRAT